MNKDGVAVWNDLYSAMKKHDWFYYYTEDPSMRKRGDQSKNRIYGIILKMKELGFEKDAKDLWKKLAPKDMKDSFPSKLSNEYREYYKEEITMNEDLQEVTIDHSRFERSHGKKAKGAGNWAFTASESGEPDDTVFVNGWLKDAAKQAARKLGTKKVYVMEENDLQEDAVSSAFAQNTTNLDYDEAGGVALFDLQNQEAVDHINAYLSRLRERTVINPYNVILEVQRHLMTFGILAECKGKTGLYVPEGESTTVSIPLTRFGGIVGQNLDGSWEDSDGFSESKRGSFSLVLTLSKNSGMYHMEGMVRSTIPEDTGPETTADDLVDAGYDEVAGDYGPEEIYSEAVSSEVKTYIERNSEMGALRLEKLVAQKFPQEDVSYSDIADCLDESTKKKLSEARHPEHVDYDDVAEYLGESSNLKVGDVILITSRMKNGTEVRVATVDEVKGSLVNYSGYHKMKPHQPTGSGQLDLNKIGKKPYGIQGIEKTGKTQAPFRPWSPKPGDPGYDSLH